MALFDKLEEANELVRPKCAYQVMVDKMDKKDRDALQAAWDKGYSQRVILRALRAEGYKTSNEAIMGHRTGQCKCPKN
jgi:hypothetical protein